MTLREAVKRAVVRASAGPNVVYRAADAGRAFLTFDDGPHPGQTEKILDLLEGAGARATFFFTGKEAEKHPAVARRAAERGHGIASHGWEHEKYAQFDLRGLGADVRRAERAIEDACGRRPAAYRPPFGRLTAALLLHCRLRGLKVVLWSLNSFDFRNPDPSEVRRNCAGASGGDIVLFHDDSAAVLEALPGVLADLKAKGLGFGVFGGSAAEIVHGNR